MKGVAFCSKEKRGHFRLQRILCHYQIEFVLEIAKMING